MHSAAPIMMILVIAASAWLIDFCLKLQNLLLILLVSVLPPLQALLMRHCSV